MFDGLLSVSAQQLLSNTDKIIIEDRKLTLRLLGHLYAIERRKLYLKLGYGSMFKYCTKHHKMSEPDAVRKIRTARCVARFQQLIPLLDSGDVSLTTVSMASKYMKPENCHAIIAAIRNKSTREVQRFLSGYEPLAAIPADRVRVIVVPAPRVEPSLVAPALRADASVLLPAACVGPSGQGTISADGKKSSSPVEPPTLVDSQEHSAAQAVAQLKFERRARVEFTAHEELMAKLERIRSLMSHRLPMNSSLDELFQFMADYVLQREDPEARQERRDVRIAKRDTQKAVRAPFDARLVPASLRDMVFVRDKRCTYVGSDGKRCESTHVLQVDHIKPVARGGAATIDNLRLLCAHHNRLESERLMGPSLRYLDATSSKA